MRWKKAGFFALAVLISGLLAVHRWGDSSHAIGLMSLNGGRTRHPAVMDGGKRHYAQITTATVLPPFEGAARIALEGSPRLDYEIYLAEPVIQLGFRRYPELRGNTLYNIKAGDRLALWTLIRPTGNEVSNSPGSGSLEFSGVFHKPLSILTHFLNGFTGRQQTHGSNASVHGRYSLAFYDAATGRPILNVPLFFTTPGGENDRHQQ